MYKIINSLFKMLLILVFVSFGLSKTYGEESDSTLQKIEDLREDIKTLEKAVYSQDGKVSSSVTELSNSSGDILTKHLLKLSELEEQFKILTNNFEEINFKLDKLSSRITKVQTDNQMRLQDLESSGMTLKEKSIVKKAKKLPGSSEPKDLGGVSESDVASVEQIQKAATDLLDKVGGIISMGGDHTIALPLLRAVNHKNKGPVALVHFDAHLDTWDTYFGAPYTHGTPFRRAREEKLFLEDSSMHVGIRGPLYSRDDLINDAEFGFKIIHCDEFQSEGIDKIVKRIRDRVRNNSLYLSIDIDVRDPAFAPGTGTPEVAGMTTREIVNVIRGLSGLNLISADVVEVSPAYDHAELTSLAAATIVYELTNLFAKSSA